MSTHLAPNAHDEGQQLVAQLIAEDGRHQKDIADEAGLSKPQLSRVATGERNLTSRTARKLGDLYPHYAERLADVAARIEDDRVAARSSNDPGWMCLRGITAHIAATSRTLVPSPNPQLKVA